MLESYEKGFTRARLRLLFIPPQKPKTQKTTHTHFITGHMVVIVYAQGDAETNQVTQPSACILHLATIFAT
jgi:hypothetical protein